MTGSGMQQARARCCGASCRGGEKPQGGARQSLARLSRTLRCSVWDAARYVGGGGRNPTRGDRSSAVVSATAGGAPGQVRYEFGSPAREATLTDSEPSSSLANCGQRMRVGFGRGASRGGRVTCATGAGLVPIPRRVASSGARRQRIAQGHQGQVDVRRSFGSDGHADEEDLGGASRRREERQGGSYQANR